MPADPFDAEVYPLPAELLGPNVPPPAEPPLTEGQIVTSHQSDDIFFLLYLCGVVLFLFVVGILLSLVAKRLDIWRPLSFAALLAGFAPAISHAQYVRGFLLYGVSSGYPAATVEQIRMAVSTFTSTSLLYALALFVLGALCVWRASWTVLLTPFAYSTVYAFFPLRPLMAALVGTDIAIDGIAHLWLGIHTVFVTCAVLGWLLGRYIVAGLRYRLERKVLR